VARKRGLGKGLDALLGGRAAASVPEAPGAHPGAAPSADLRADAPEGGLRRIPLDLIRPGPDQPRRRFDPAALQELADSIRAQGVVQPVVVRPAPEGGYELVAGERRWRAAQLAGLQEIPAVVRRLDGREAAAVALIENIQREDLNALEQARALARLVEEFGLTHQEVAEAVGRSRSAVSNTLRLLELEPEVQRLVEEGALEMGHARALLALGGAAQREAAARVVAKGLSVRETERLVRRLVQGGTSRRPVPARDPDVARLERELGERLGAPVRIEHRARGRGRLVIEYASLEELDGLLERLGAGERPR